VNVVRQRFHPARKANRVDANGPVACVPFDHPTVLEEEEEEEEGAYSMITVGGPGGLSKSRRVGGEREDVNVLDVGDARRD
jgi:hypothetical protein